MVSTARTADLHRRLLGCADRSSATRAPLLFLFAFSGTSGIFAPAGSPDQLSDPTAGTTALPGNWVADFRQPLCAGCEPRQ